MFEEHTTHSVPSAPLHSRLERDILKVLLYFDIFNHPVKAQEIYSFLPSNSTNPTAIARQCQSFPLNEYLAEERGMYFLSSRTHSVRIRLEKEQLARRRWNIAKVMAHIIKLFPFVRGVFVSGELSKGVASKQGDIDFVIVTAKNRLWICRTMLILFKKIFLLNRKKYFCVNHFVSEDHLSVEVRNRYSAIEIATLKPLYNYSLFDNYLRANTWITEFLPNWKFDEQQTRSNSRKQSFVRWLCEIPFSGAIGNRLDAWLMHQWRTIWKRRYRHLSNEERDRLFQSRRFISTAYGEDFQTKILTRYEQRLVQFGIQRIAEENFLIPAIEKS